MIYCNRTGLTSYFAFIVILFLHIGIIQAEPNQIKVMTWNIWGKLNQAPQYTIDGKTARQRMIEVIKESKADVIAMIETYGSAKDIAEELGYHHYTPSESANLAIFSRFPLKDVGTPESLSSFSFIYATVQLPDGKQIRIYDVWLTSGGRHIVEIKNKELSDKEFTKGDDNRFKHVQQLSQHPEFKNDIANKDNIPVIVAGDFNCVSHLDYTEETKKKQLNYSRILSTKTSIAMAQAGFTDTYRFVHPKITPKTLGHTWTTVGKGFIYVSDKGFVPVEINSQPEYRDPYTRIDFIYSAGNKLKPVKSKTITHHSSNNKRSFPELPSDHAAVITTFELNYQNRNEQKDKIND